MPAEFKRSRTGIANPVRLRDACPVLDGTAQALSERRVYRLFIGRLEESGLQLDDAPEQAGERLLALER